MRRLRDVDSHRFGLGGIENKMTDTEIIAEIRKLQDEYARHMNASEEYRRQLRDSAMASMAVEDRIRELKERLFAEAPLAPKA